MGPMYVNLAWWIIAISNAAIAVAQFKRVSPRRGMLVHLDPVGEGEATQAAVASTTSKEG